MHHRFTVSPFGNPDKKAGYHMKSDNIFKIQKEFKKKTIYIQNYSIMFLARIGPNNS